MKRLIEGRFGRGYSDNPYHVHHDVRLFTSQIMIALSSSPLSWIGDASGKFALVGYSLGGGIAAAFTSYFPLLVSSLILIAPAGLLRGKHITRTSRILYSEGLIPEGILDRLVRARLRTPLAPPQPPSNEEKLLMKDAVAAETPNLESNSRIPVSRAHPNVTVEDAVNFQLDHHSGFVQAFMSSIRHGPILSQHEDWRRIGRRLTAQNNAEKGSQVDGGLQHGKVLIICGVRDPIIKRDELGEDAGKELEGNVIFKDISAGHEAPITRSDEVVKFIWNFWETGR